MENKNISVLGLGKMGANIARRLIGKGWRVFGFNVPYETTKELEKEGLIGARSLKELAEKVEAPRLLWLMLPAGQVVDNVIFGRDKEKGLVDFLEKGDTIIDGGNSFYKDSIRRAKELKKRQINFIDVGFSGGPSGALNGASLMIGGSKALFEKFSPLYKSLAAKDAYQFFEGDGAGHFVKMVHNGIEYGMMQSLAEGFTILKESQFNIDLEKASDVYNHQSVIESRLVDWLKESYARYGSDLSTVSGIVGHTGEAEWTVAAAKELKVKPTVIEESLKFRIQTENNPSYTGKILSALRDGFGGHGIKK